MASTSIENDSRERVRNNVHRIDWAQSITEQLQLRKSIEQTPFEDICSFANGIFETVDICKTENIQLKLQREQLQQQLLEIQQTILAGGSVAAKSILSKFATTDLSEVGSDTSSSPLSSNASLLSEKARLEKKVLDLQEKLADALKTTSDSVQKIVDLKTEIDEKDRINRQLTTDLTDRNIEMSKLRDKLEELERNHKIMTDEHIALTLSYKSLEKRHHNLKLESDSLKQTVLAVKLNDAERLNAENERIMIEQQERIKKDLEANVAALNQNLIARQAAGDAAALALATDNFEYLDDDETTISLNACSRIPSELEFQYDAHEGEACALYWYFCKSPKDDYLATGGSDRKVKIWKISNGVGTNVATLLGSNASITSIDVEGDVILASSNDYATRVWSLDNHKLKNTLTGHSAKVNSAKFLGTSDKMASGSQDRTIKIWDTSRGACLKTYFAGSNCFDLVYNNYQVITGHFDGKIRCWDLKHDDNEPIIQMALQSKITSLDLSKDGTKLLCSLRDDTIKCIDLRGNKMEVLQTYSGEKFKVGLDSTRARFSTDGQLISCGSPDGIYIWDATTAKVQKILTGASNTTHASCWSPDGQRMATVERGKKISIWF